MKARVNSPGGGIKRAPWITTRERKRKGGPLKKRGQWRGENEKKKGIS